MTSEHQEVAADSERVWDAATDAVAEYIRNSINTNTEIVDPLTCFFHISKLDLYVQVAVLWKLFYEHLRVERTTASTHVEAGLYLYADDLAIWVGKSQTLSFTQVIAIAVAALRAHNQASAAAGVHTASGELTVN
jgi:hypothetical protein